ncbi:MAG: penicillin acylase family protein [Alphaproteobacteria bacterium]|nr:penicillin acylase family protein [Alphaproteobacteria bacterium]
MRLVKGLFLGIGVLVALPFVIVGILAALAVTSLPETEGRQKVAGLDQAIEIRRDARAIPRIVAEDMAGAAFGLGYAHAQDRLVQMELIRRFGRGEVSAIVGSLGLGTDKMMRTLGVHRLALETYEQLPPASRDILDGYAAGVNAWRRAHSGFLPLEFQLLAHDFEPWRPEDSLIVQRLLGLMLSSDWRDEARRVKLAGTLEPRELAFFLSDEGVVPAIPPMGHPLPKDTAALIQDVVDGWPAAIAPRRASNAWAVDGSRSVSGRPILASDPHLGVLAPNIWYAARLEADGKMVVGGTIPGAPLVMIGHNGKIAWGLTTAYADTADLVIERLAGENGSRYLTQNGPKDFTVREEVIEVRFGDPEVIQVRETRHGPVVSDAVSSVGAITGSGTALVLKATALDPNDRSAESLLRLNMAESRAEAMEALALFQSPQQNIVFAAATGEIGLITAGAMPKRIDQNGGRLPAEGWKHEALWDGYVPLPALPQVHSPETGVVLNANDRIAPPEDPWFGQGPYTAPFRAERIAERLNHRKLWSAETMAALQMDSTGMGATHLLPLLMANLDEGRLTSPAGQLLAQWTYRMDRELAAPLIYNAWIKALWPKLIADDLGDHAESYQRPKPITMIGILRDRPQWCDDRATPDVDSCAGLIRASFDETVASLTEEFGDKLRKWRWGTVHQTHFKALPFGYLPVIGPLFTVSEETDGGPHSILRAAMSYRGATPFANVHTAGLRMAVDLGMPEEARFMVALGQSGNLYSRHYRDLATAWANGETFTIPSDPGPEAEILQLLPR